MKFGRNKAQSDERTPARRLNRNDTQPVRPTAAELSNRYSFRRNRTLTGSSSPEVASSNELNAELRSPRAHAHHLTGLRRKLLVGLIGIIVITSVLYVLIAQLVATVAVQVNEGGLLPLADKQAYQASFESYYASRPAERLRFLLNKPALLSHIRSTRPEVRSINVDAGSAFGEASVSVETRRPIARWNINGNNLYVDGDGIVFNRNFYNEPRLQIIDDSGLGTRGNRLLASDRFLGFIGRIVAGTENFDLVVDKVTIPQLTTRQVALTLKGKKTQYRLSVDQPAGEQVENVARTRKYLNQQNSQPDYVDLRVTGKAYYN